MSSLGIWAVGTLPRAPSLATRAEARGVLALTLLLVAIPLAGQQPSPPPASEAEAQPIVRADDIRQKVTMGLYLGQGGALDINLRHQFGSTKDPHWGFIWLGSFRERYGTEQTRLGGELDWSPRNSLLLQETVQVATHHALTGAIYSEIGDPYYAIAGFQRTNGHPFTDLFFDPNDAGMIGGGVRLNNYDRVYAISIFDVRYHTSQQDTHVLWRRKLDAHDGLTVDLLYKSGRGDSGRTIRAAGIGLYFDRPTWFAKAYYDPHVNFSEHTMVRIGMGKKF
ncbi:MAG TPA: hypothetical protein VEZ11_00670 [Thermoanaerobaculia bacterium]|nr:hypothetical protein [Thermoanaerobaculia bacterium]